MTPFDEWEIDLHGHRVDLPDRRRAARPSSSSTGWSTRRGTGSAVALRLADALHRHRARPDRPRRLSATPRGDYSLGAHAAGIRDLLAAIGVDRASIVGHSLGGGVAMQFFYQFPQRVERLVLVSSGGLGQRGQPAAAQRGAARRLGRCCRSPRTGACSTRCRRAASRCSARGTRKGVYLQAIARALRPLERAGRARGVPADAALGHRRARPARQRARPPLPAARRCRRSIVWGERDHTIPIEHGRAAHRAVPHSRFETLPRAAHFPHLEDPAGLAEVLRDFLDTTEPAQMDDADWGPLLSGRARATVRQA